MEYIVGSVIAGLIVALVVAVVRFFLRKPKPPQGDVKGGIVSTGADATLIGNVVVVNDPSRGQISDKAIMGEAASALTPEFLVVHPVARNANGLPRRHRHQVSDKSREVDAALLTQARDEKSRLGALEDNALDDPLDGDGLGAGEKIMGFKVGHGACARGCEPLGRSFSASCGPRDARVKATLSHGLWGGKISNEKDDLGVEWL